VKYMLLLYGHYGCFIFAVVMVLLWRAWSRMPHACSMIRQADVVNA
jgi:hypothetical protein